MPEIDIKSIVVNPDTRQREDLGDLQGLASSIEEFGQLEPILVDDKLLLVAGFRRFSACLILGRPTIKVEFLGELTEIRKQEIELEENIRRHQLNWQEESNAVARIHKLKQAKDPNWSIDQTAQAVGISRRKVFMAIELDGAVARHPEIGKAETQAGALLRHEHIKHVEKRKIEAKIRVDAVESGVLRQTTQQVNQGDAVAQMELLASEQYDMIVSNPPYGVNIESVFIGSRTIYSDEEKPIVEVCKAVCQQAFRLLKPDRWFVWFYPTVRLEEGKQMLREAGFEFQEMPCMWYKPDKFMSGLAEPYQNFSSQYETFFWARKGKPKFSKLRLGNVFAYNTLAGTRLHPLQMPVDLWKEILSVGSVSGEWILEPFSGSGSCGVACVETDRNYTGLELSPEYVARSNMWINEAQNGITHNTTRAIVAQELDHESGFDALATLEQVDA